MQPPRAAQRRDVRDEVEWYRTQAAAHGVFLIEGKKGSKPFMRVEPQLYIRSGDGFSEELQMIYDTGKEEK